MLEERGQDGGTGHAAGEPAQQRPRQEQRGHVAPQERAVAAPLPVDDGAVARPRLLQRPPSVQHAAQEMAAGPAGQDRGADTFPGQREALPRGVAGDEDAAGRRKSGGIPDPRENLRGVE